MAESTGSNKGLGQPPDQMSTETRLLLAFLLMGAIMFFSPQFFKTAVPPDAKKSTQAAKTGEGPVPAPVSSAEASPPAEIAEAGKAPTAPVIQGQQEPFFVVSTDLFKVTFSNQGANVRGWVLKQSLAEGKPLDLVNSAGVVEDPTNCPQRAADPKSACATIPTYPFSLYLPGHGGEALTKKLNTAFYQKTPDPDGLGVTYDFSDGHTTVRKTFRFQKNSFLVQITSEVATDGQPVTHMIEWRAGFGDLTLTTAATKQQTIYYDLTANKLREYNAGNAKNGPATNSGNFSFAGIEDGYFTAVFLPEGNAAMQEITFSDTTPTPYSDKAVAFVGAAVSMGAVNHFDAFVGPKDYDLLKRVNPRLEQLVNFGWMSLLAKPLFLVVNWFNDNVVHNFGWAIVLVTVVINFALFPLKMSNMKSMRKMQALKPQIDAINAKYKSVKITDPKKGEQNQEVMDLYKKHGVNPMGGCVPMLLQIPFFFAFYTVFRVSVEMRGANWLWIHDLSQAEPSVIKVLPIVMIASQFIMQKMTPQANVDPSQQKMMQFMPLLFGFMFYSFASGLVLYYLTSNLVSMGQQWFFNHTEAAQEAARSVEPPKKKIGRK
jgi:YidC/Oxa1 family membrane protein insertase